MVSHGAHHTKKIDTASIEFDWLEGLRRKVLVKDTEREVACGWSFVLRTVEGADVWNGENADASDGGGLKGCALKVEVLV